MHTPPTVVLRTLHVNLVWRVFVNGKQELWDAGMTGKCLAVKIIQLSIIGTYLKKRRGMLSGWQEEEGLINASSQGVEVHAAKVRRTGGVWSGAGTLAGRATAAPRQHRSRGAGPRSWAPAYHTGRTAVTHPLACQLIVMPPDTPGTTGLL